MQRYLLLICSTGFGIITGLLLILLVIAWPIYFATDDPGFQALLVALVVAAPISLPIGLVQFGVVIYELKNKHYLRKGLIWIGMGIGLVSGVFFSSHSNSLPRFRHYVVSRYSEAFSGCRTIWISLAG